VSVRLEVDLKSPVGGRLSWMQHAASLAVVLAVGDARLGVKWPNDLYWEGGVKVGGVLAEVDIHAATAICRIGIGVNLDNAAPTVCLNARLAAPLSREALIAGTLTQLERLLQLEVSQLSALYQDHWLHHEQRVTVTRECREMAARDDREMAAPARREVAARVTGLDEYGYLVVRAVEDGEEMIVSPDGNSFDMMRGLIVPKRLG